MVISHGEKRIPGEAGLWILIFGDLFVFGMFFATFGYYRFAEPLVFRASQPVLDQRLGLLNTLILLTSSFCVVKAVKAARAGLASPGGRWALAGIALGLCFVGVKAIEYGEKVTAGIYPTTNMFFMLYFAFTGIHLVHVLIGIGVLFLLRFRVVRPAVLGHDPVADGCAIFWHMVDLLWVVLFAIFYMHR